MAAPNIGYIIATGIDSRTKVLADNLLNNNALLRELKKRGNTKKTFSGGEYIIQELMFNDPSTNTVDSFSGYDTIDIIPNNAFDAAKFGWAQYAASVTYSGRDRLINSGKEKTIDLIESRITAAEAQLMNRLDMDLFLDGTGNGGKNLTGLAAAIADTPTNTYGAINRSTWTFWKNQTFSGVTDGGAAVSAANIQAYMTALSLNLIRGSDRPDMILAGATYYKHYVESLQAIQQVTDADSASAGFTSLMFNGGGGAVKVIMGGGIGSNTPATRMYFINSKYLHWRPHADMNFARMSGGERHSVNQDATVILFGWAGNLTCSGSQFQGVLKP